MKPVPMRLINGIVHGAHRIAMGVVLTAMFAMPHAVARDAAPDALVKAVTQNVIAAIRQDGTIGGTEPAKVAELIEARMRLLFDFTRMTQIAVARNWRLASSVQQKALVKEFTLLLADAFVASLSRYCDQIIEIRPLHVVPGDMEVTVKSVVKQSGAAPISMNYEMERTAAGWKVYDIKIDGNSLMSAYREAFAEKIRYSGLDGLIQSIMDKNQHGEERFRSRPTEEFYFPILIWAILQGGR